MTHVHAMAILMGLAPNPPRDYEHESRPNLGAAPELDAYIGAHREQAEALEYYEGDFETNFYTDAETLAQVFRDEGGSTEMAAAEPYQYAVKAVIDQHPGSRKSHLQEVADKLVAGLEQYAVDWRTWKVAHDETMARWEGAREIAWRRDWAERLLEAAQPTD